MGNCLKHGIKVYPVSINGYWHIEIDNNNKITTGLKQIAKGNGKNGIEISQAMEDTYKYFDNKLNEQNEQSEKSV